MGLGETDVLHTCALRDMDTQGPLAGAGFLTVTVTDVDTSTLTAHLKPSTAPQIYL